MIDPINPNGRVRAVAPDSGRDPEWTRDGRRVVFTKPFGDSEKFVSRARDRSSADMELGRAKATGVLLPGLQMGVPHGVAATTHRNSSNPALFEVDLTPMDSVGVFHTFAPSSASNHSPSISADGRLLAWVSNESGSNQVYVRPMSGGARIRVSVNGGSEPLWSRSGTTLFYRASSSVMSADIGESPLPVTRQDSLFADRFVRNMRIVGRQWDVFPDGKEFLMLQLLESDTKAVFVVLNCPQLKVSPPAAAPP